MIISSSNTVKDIAITHSSYLELIFGSNVELVIIINKSIVILIDSLNIKFAVMKLPSTKQRKDWQNNQSYPLSFLQLKDLLSFSFYF